MRHGLAWKFRMECPERVMEKRPGKMMERVTAEQDLVD